MMRCLLLIVIVCCAGCAGAVKAPVAALADGSLGDSVHRRAVSQLEAVPRSDAQTIDALQGLVYRAGFQHDVRRRGMDLLMTIDREQLVRTLRQRLPRVTDKPWLRAMCAWVGQQQWTQEEADLLVEALVSSWGRVWSGGMPERQRPEVQALSQLRPDADFTELVWNMLLVHDKPSQEGYRYRCWTVLHRLGARDRLIEVLASNDAAAASNPMLVDLQAAAAAFGTVPWNREEILWLRKLREPSRLTFWNQAQAACAAMTPARREVLRIRDLPVAVAAQQHRPDLAGASEASMAEALTRRLANIQHYSEENATYKGGRFSTDHLRDHVDVLTWGDLAAINLALDAMDVGLVVAHLFDYADRDNAETDTEFGGIIALDDKGRYEVQEFHPRLRHHDLRFNAPQAMFDAGYTGLFHFHFHATTHRNRDHAGPGLGDLTYADETRANCLVLTFINEDTLNVDWYRHDGVVVDLGCVHRPGVQG